MFIRKNNSLQDNLVMEKRKYQKGVIRNRFLIKI